MNLLSPTFFTWFLNDNTCFNCIAHKTSNHIFIGIERILFSVIGLPSVIIKFVLFSIFFSISKNVFSISLIIFSLPFKKFLSIFKIKRSEPSPFFFSISKHMSILRYFTDGIN